jgi:hypothetical protein
MIRFKISVTFGVWLVDLAGLLLALYLLVK